MKKYLAVILAMIAVASVQQFALADTGPTQPSPTVPAGTCTAQQHKQFVQNAVRVQDLRVPKSAWNKHASLVSCAVDTQTGAAMQVQWQRALNRHTKYVHAVLLYPGGKNPIGTHKWATTYCIAVAESGAGSAAPSNIYGFTPPAYSYRPSWYDGSFWAQSVAAYNLATGYGSHSHQFGGWNNPCPETGG